MPQNLNKYTWMMMNNFMSNHPSALVQCHHILSSFSIIADKSSCLIIPQHYCRHYHVSLAVKNKSDAFII